MTRRTNYRILEGTKEAPRRMIVRVGSHNRKYGRASLPNALVGKLVEVIIPEVPIEDSVLGSGEPPVVSKRKLKTESESVAETVVAAVVEPAVVTDQQAVV